MRKTFPLQMPGKADARVLDIIKHEVRKYVKRERRKLLPEGFVDWIFACKVGASPAVAEPVPLKEISAAVDRVAQGTNHEVYIEIIAAPSAVRAAGAIA
jgi:hypothetical protein